MDEFLAKFGFSFVARGDVGAWEKCLHLWSASPCLSYLLTTASVLTQPRSCLTSLSRVARPGELVWVWVGGVWKPGEGCGGPAGWVLCQGVTVVWLSWIACGAQSCSWKCERPHPPLLPPASLCVAHPFSPQVRSFLHTISITDVYHWCLTSGATSRLGLWSVPTSCCAWQTPSCLCISVDGPKFPEDNILWRKRNIAKWGLALSSRANKGTNNTRTRAEGDFTLTHPSVTRHQHRSQRLADTPGGG